MKKMTLHRTCSQPLISAAPAIGWGMDCLTVSPSDTDCLSLQAASATPDNRKGADKGDAIRRKRREVPAAIFGVLRFLPRSGEYPVVGDRRGPTAASAG
jgi:hypothetical protein